MKRCAVNSLGGLGATILTDQPVRARHPIRLSVVDIAVNRFSHDERHTLNFLTKSSWWKRGREKSS
jgi:hypothetical protein